MHASKDSMWRGMWKILQNFLQTKLDPVRLLNEQYEPPIQGCLWRESSKEPGTNFHDKPKLLGTYQTALGSTTPAHLRGEGQNEDSLRWCRTGETAMAAFFLPGVEEEQ